MCLRFCKTKSRETRGESILELFPTLPTYQNPINMNLGPISCKGFFDFSVFQFFDPIGPLFLALVVALSSGLMLHG